MEALGEVGKKMRSAIKAKLVELGNASQTGYIDDELPDYVMIMVANKRSKQQMLTDLNLFLGSNTESFVNWLHQVLQKLQEVTLPSSLASKAKKKIGDSSTKKDKKKDKKKGGKEPSITDVIAVELMEKAKKTIDPEVKNERSKTPSPPPAPHFSDEAPEQQTPTPPRISDDRNKEHDDDEFNIPTISELTTSSTNQNLHKKELMQLKDLQNRIYETKRKLVNFSDREDNANDEASDKEEETSMDTSETQRKSIKSRLGVKPTENSKPSNIISLSAIRKTETELYKSTAFRKLIEKQKEENERRSTTTTTSVRDRIDMNNRYRRDRRSRSRSNSRRDRIRRRSRSRSPIRRSQERKSRPSIRQRVGNHRTLSRSRTPEMNDGKNFKVKQRPILSSAVHVRHVNAGRNLLMRAMADARRSTTNTSARRRENIVVQVRNTRVANDEEYVPESISGHSESEAEYHPACKREREQDNMDDDGDVIIYNDGNVDLDDLEDNNEVIAITKSPQFVVTFDNDAPEEYTQNTESSHEKSKSPTPPPVIKRNRKSIKDRIGARNVEKYNNNESNKHEDVEIRSRKRRNTDDGIEVDEECESQRAYNKVKKTRVSPIKFDLTDDENENGGGKSRSNSRDRHHQKTPTKSEINLNKVDQNGEEHAKRIRLDALRNFDHVPPLSSVAIPVTESSKPLVKSKERCKFYPSCSNASCLFYHPTLPCKVFPNCKYGDACAYIHPKCKFDISCNRIDCNFTHSPIIAPLNSPLVASSIVPAQNYKSITITPNSTICKFFPNCTNTNCIYQHPKICKFGKNCANKYDCNFFHFEMSSKNKFKWISST